jgi:hypothetical protein
MTHTTATLGIDLASQPKSTALCAVAWEPRGARITALFRGVAADGVTRLHDKLLVSAMRGLWGGLPTPTKVAIDAPLGWPVDFVQGVAEPESWPVGIDNDRKRLERRATDHWIHRETGKQPLSVTTDRIGYAAMRAAGLLVHYASTFGERVDRSGVDGLVCETYPDPAIRRFGLWPGDAGARQSYKGDARSVRERIIDRLAQTAPWLEVSAEQRLACVNSDDCLDAVICALVARAVERGLTVAPPDEVAEEARLEGWIHLPTRDSLRALI